MASNGLGICPKTHQCRQAGRATNHGWPWDVGRGGVGWDVEGGAVASLRHRLPDVTLATHFTESLSESTRPRGSKHGCRAVAWVWRCGKVEWDAVSRAGGVGEWNGMRKVRLWAFVPLAPDAKHPVCGCPWLSVTGAVCGCLWLRLFESVFDCLWLPVAACGWLWLWLSVVFWGCLWQSVAVAVCGCLCLCVAVAVVCGCL